MKKIILFTAATTFLSISAQAAVSGAATVVVLKGTAKNQAGKALKEKDSIDPGTTISTAPRSFVKLMFKDGSQMNVGPDTTMKIENTKPGEPGLVNLVGGQIRAKVTKDLLKGNEGDGKDKLVIKTKTAAMGIRGTDFNVSFNGKNNSTALVTFEGNVVMAKISGNESPSSALNSSEVKSVGAGQYSGANPEMAQATARLSQLAPDASVAILVSGSRAGFASFARARAHLPREVHTFAITVDRGGAMALRETAGMSVLTVGTLADLPRVLLGVSVQ